MENYEYICHYCGKSYVPRRRYVQRYCCTTCRVNAFKRRIKSSTENSVKDLSIPQKEVVKDNPKISLAGVGNAAIANMVTDFTKSVFTREENKPATKGDLWALMKQQPQQRYLPVHNAPQRNDGTLPFYDTVTKTVVYRQALPSLDPQKIFKK